jgi:hypothetical protein
LPVDQEHELDARSPTSLRALMDVETFSEDNVLKGTELRSEKVKSSAFHTFDQIVSEGEVF